MKNLKTKITAVKFLAILILVTLSFSCSPEDGKDGEDGIQGEQGINGVNGEDGEDSVDGEDGEDGDDGNANVQNFIVDISSESGIFMNIRIPEITDEVRDNDLVLGYYTTGNGLTQYPMPGLGHEAFFETRVSISSGFYVISFYNPDRSGDRFDLGMNNVTINTVRVLIIKSTSSTTVASKTTSKEAVLNELNNADVDINDYYAVCDYYGIAY